MSSDIIIGLAPGCKCQRCRKFAIEVGLIVQWPDLCRDCAVFMEVVRPQPAYDRLQRQLLDHPIRRLAHDPSVPGVVYPDGLIDLAAGRGRSPVARQSANRIGDRIVIETQASIEIELDQDDDDVS